jgi:hypothetical protein
MQDLAPILKEWGAFGLLFVLALLVIRALFAKLVESWEARLRDCLCLQEMTETQKDILGAVREIRQQNRSLTSVLSKADGDKRGGRS